MRKEIEKISVFGSRKHIEEAEKALEVIDKEVLKSEPEARLEIQKLIDDNKLKADILYDGNIVWSYNKIIRNIKQIKQKGILGTAGYIQTGSMMRVPENNAKPVLSDYTYKFLSLSCGSIAHYSKAGWIAEYPTVDHLKGFFQHNEFRQRVLEYLPDWKTDAKRIVDTIERALGI